MIVYMSVNLFFTAKQQWPSCSFLCEALVLLGIWRQTKIFKRSDVFMAIHIHCTDIWCHMMQKNKVYHQHAKRAGKGSQKGHPFSKNIYHSQCLYGWPPESPIIVTFWLAWVTIYLMSDLSQFITVCYINPQKCVIVQVLGNISNIKIAFMKK